MTTVKLPEKCTNCNRLLSWEVDLEEFVAECKRCGWQYRIKPTIELIEAGEI